MPEEMSISQLARLAHVSTATVSRVFNETGYVQEDTKNRILQLAQTYHYKPRSYKKRSVAQTHDPFIGVVVADLHNVFFQDIIEHLSAVLSGHQIGVMLCNSAESSQQEIRSLSMLRQLHADGIIISPVSEIAEYNADFLKSLHRDGTPVILIDRDIKGFGLDGVFQDNFNGAVKAVNALVECGHQHIATVAGPITSRPGLDRLNGYLDALKSNDIPIRQEYIGYGDFKLDSGYQITRKLVSRYPQITALFCANNLMAVGALRALRDCGMSVPNDMALISYGSLNQFDLYDDAVITEVYQPSDMMGEECGNIMIEKMNGESKRKNAAARRITYDATLILKGSEAYPVNRKNGAKEE